MYKEQDNFVGSKDMEYMRIFIGWNNAYNYDIFDYRMIAHYWLWSNTTIILNYWIIEKQIHHTKQNKSSITLYDHEFWVILLLRKCTVVENIISHNRVIIETQQNVLLCKLNYDEKRDS